MTVGSPISQTVHFQGQRRPGMWLLLTTANGKRASDSSRMAGSKSKCGG